jgi:hypothetical protein
LAIARFIPIRVQDDKKPSPKIVIPAKAGIHGCAEQARRIEEAFLDSRLRGNDGVFFRLEREMELDAIALY